MTVFKSDVMNLNINSAVAYLTFKRLDKYDFLKHAFSTRLGGESEGCFKSMNFTLRTGEKKENIKRNYDLFCEAIDLSLDSFVMPDLVHGNSVAEAKSEDRGSGGMNLSNFPDTDALITNQSGVTLVVSAADCPSIFILDPVKKAIGLAHSGWRGTVKMIAQKTINKMSENFGCNAKDLICCVGPAICGNCFQVKNDVVDEFKKLNLNNVEDVILNKENGYYINLYEANKQILLNSGVNEENIILSDICTMCNKDLLFSHRGSQGKRGVMLAVMCLK